MDEVRITIIGAGVVGLAIASELSTRYDNIVVLEKHESFGLETSSRNSEVIHSGIYYPEGSLKARLCVEGAEELLTICKKESIPHKKLGKLIVATDQSELCSLEKFLEKGRKNYVKDLVLLDKRDVLKIERHTNAAAAIHSPNTGIIDVHSLMKHFYYKSQSNNVIFSFNSEVELVAKEGTGFRIGIRQENYHFKSAIVINCAGLCSDAIAGMAGIDMRKYDYTLKLCKGSYFSYAKPSPVKMLIYPLPHQELVGLGVHATLDMGGRLRFGPDAEYIHALDYQVDRTKRDAFYQGASKIIRGLDKEAFAPDMAGVRPKLQGPGEKVRDFIIADETEKGLSGLINLIGIESPGLTAASAIARMVARIVSKLIN
jgi:L-2-hydroxyglutarate oxidase LhgO